MKQFLAAIVLVPILALSARAQPVPATPSRTGYLSTETTPDVAKVVPPAPETGDVRFNADMAIYRATRAIEGSPRWTMAQSDDNVSTAGIFNAFSCSLGMNLARENAPKTVALVTRSNVDAGRAAGLLKNLYGHKRPFQVEDGNVCLSPQGKTALERSPDYPSGHTAASWEAGLILAQILPRRSTGILARARAFGESRVVCGVHNASAVEAGWMTATAVFAAQNSSQEFQADLKGARVELEELLKSPPATNQACSLEVETLSYRPY
ncbi:MAG: phosphatase PAP2 family protein [Acidobacteriota bacterium]